MGGLKSYFDGRKYLMLIYTILVTIFSLIIQTSLTRMFLYLSLGNLDFIILIGLSCLYLSLLDRGVKTEVVVLIGIIIGGILITILHGGDLIFRYLFMIILHMIILTLNRCLEITREDVKEKAKKMIVWILISSFGFIDKNENYFYLIGQLSITFFIIYIYLLRIIRDFYYRLKKENTKQNITYLILILLLFVDSTQKIFVMVFKFGVGIISFLLGELLGVVAIILAPILSKIKIPSELAELFFKLPEGPPAKMITENGVASTVKILGVKIDVFKIVQIVAAVVFILIIYIIIKKLYLSFQNVGDENGIRIEREKIKNRSKIRKKERIKTPVTIKEKILYNYREFLIKAKKKELYKDYMTGRQVQSRVGAEVCQVQEELKVMTSIYNEVKFSNHDVDEEKLKDFKESYDKVKEVF